MNNPTIACLFMSVFINIWFLNNERGIFIIWSLVLVIIVVRSIVTFVIRITFKRHQVHCDLGHPEQKLITFDQVEKFF